MKIPQLTITAEALAQFDEASRKEWIITNGLGGYASSTILGINTRKYHGLLVSALNPPSDRRVCLEKLDEEVHIADNIYPLGSNEFQNRIFPQGYKHLKEFAAAPFPSYVYYTNKVKVRKTIFLPYGKNVAVALYEVQNGNCDEAKLRIYPLLNMRHFHSVTARSKICEPILDQKNGDVNVEFGDPNSTMIVRSVGGQYFAEKKWLEHIYYREEANRGESCLDDYFQSGFFEFKIKPESSSVFAAVTVGEKEMTAALRIMKEMPATQYDVINLFEKEMERREDFLAKFYSRHQYVPREDWLSPLILGSDSFVVTGARAEKKSVIAGYYWFECWGRDTFISLPGLMLINERYEDARKTFLNYAKHCKRGLIPNFLPDVAGEPAYNSVDASLWFLNALLQYLKYTGDLRFVKENLWETLKDIVENYVEGTLFGIHMSEDGLLSHAGQLTWMDAVVNGKPVTPRKGKAVEIQALWYNALRTMNLLADKFDEHVEAERYLHMSEKTRKSFSEEFWNNKRNCLFDVTRNGEKDNSFRPNQIIAVSLDFAMLDDDRNKMIVDTVERELLTPFGLRTLEKNDARYFGIYEGNRQNRDTAYHNGTVWPWLLGPFTTAYLKANGCDEKKCHHALKHFLLPLFHAQATGAKPGMINEVFDGDPPHEPRGCIAQAWSTAEPLRAYVEHVLQVRPAYETWILQGSR